jgi:hypothetical protein
MRPHLSRTLIRLYPASWRARYEEEFATFLEAEPSDTRTALNIVAWACRERVRSFIEGDMAAPGRGLTLIGYAYLAAIVAGVNLYWMLTIRHLLASCICTELFSLSGESSRGGAKTLASPDSQHLLGGGRTCWAHFEFTRIDIEPIIPKKKIEDTSDSSRS